MIETTEAIVLKSLKYGDTSKIVTLYTKSFGKTTVIAKGARGKTSKFGSALEPMSYIAAVFYRKENRDIQLLSQADLIEVHRSLNDDEKKLSVGLCIIEFLHASIHDQEQHEEVFNLTKNALSALNASPQSEINFLVWYLIHLISLHGFEFDFSRCVNCHKDLASGFENDHPLRFNMDKGTLFCQTCAEHFPYEQIPAEQVRIMQWFTAAAAGTVDSLAVHVPTGLRMVHLLHRFLQHHLNGMKRIYSLSMLESFFSPNESNKVRNK